MEESHASLRVWDGLGDRPRRLGGRGPEAVDRQPHYVILKGPGEAAVMTRPRHPGNDRPVMAIRHPRRASFKPAEARFAGWRPPASPARATIKASRQPATHATMIAGRHPGRTDATIPAPHPARFTAASSMTMSRNLSSRAHTLTLPKSCYAFQGARPSSRSRKPETRLGVRASLSASLNPRKRQERQSSEVRDGSTEIGRS